MLGASTTPLRANTLVDGVHALAQGLQPVAGFTVSRGRFQPLRSGYPSYRVCSVFIVLCDSQVLMHCMSLPHRA